MMTKSRNPIHTSAMTGFSSRPLLFGATFYLHKMKVEKGRRPAESLFGATNHAFADDLSLSHGKVVMKIQGL